MDSWVALLVLATLLLMFGREFTSDFAVVNPFHGWLLTLEDASPAIVQELISPGVRALNGSAMTGVFFRQKLGAITEHEEANDVLAGATDATHEHVASL